MKTEKKITVFISYSWDSDEHKNWVKKFADELIRNGLDVYLDQYDLRSGDRTPHFMEDKIMSSDFVLVVCTDAYKVKADQRKGGVGYEGNIISGELIHTQNERKFIPILRSGSFEKTLPTFMLGKMGIDFSDSKFNETSFRDLLATLYGVRRKPEIGMPPKFINTTNYYNYDKDEVTILGIITNEVTIPKMDGSAGSALYKIPFQLSKTPSSLWTKLFLQNWDSPPSFTTMHRPSIASVYSDKILLNGTTIEEVKKYHRETLILCVEISNQQEKQIQEQERIKQEQREKRERDHYNNVINEAKDIKF